MANDQFNSHGLPRQRWPAPPSPPGSGGRYDKVAFRLSSKLRESIAYLADVDRLPVSSWLEKTVRTEVERRLRRIIKGAARG